MDTIRQQTLFRISEAVRDETSSDLTEGSEKEDDKSMGKAAFETVGPRGHHREEVKAGSGSAIAAAVGGSLHGEEVVAGSPIAVPDL